MNGCNFWSAEGLSQLSFRDARTSREHQRCHVSLSWVPPIVDSTDHFMTGGPGPGLLVEDPTGHGTSPPSLRYPVRNVGDRFYFDGAGNLLTKRCPKKVCIYALNAAAGLIFASNELVYAGVDPNEMRFKRAGCFDVGVRCGGWGRVVFELNVVDR